MMKNSMAKVKVILMVILATILFSIFRMMNSLLQIANTLYEKGWSLLAIILVSVLAQMLFTGFVVLIVLPINLGFTDWRVRLKEYLRLDRKVVLSGIFSFGIFCVLAVVISLAMGIFTGDISTVFAYPDIDPEPDVVGWGYFLLALIPGIWEELAFRGLIQSKISEIFSTTIAVLLSSLFFALFHFSNLLTQAPSQVVFGVIMAFCFGIGWGFMTVRARSVVPAMISHYLVDSLGSIFLGVDSSDPALMTGFFVLLTLMFPVFNIILGKIIYKDSELLTEAGSLR
jgi:membrane protease YdiL (CAAX protease family)